MASLEEFNSEVQRKRIEKCNLQSEIQLLSPTYSINTRNNPFGLCIELQINSYKFIAHLYGKFPLQAPLLTIHGNFPYPSIADGRDLLPVFTSWTPTMTIKDLFQQVQSSLDKLQTSEIGKFHLGQYVDLCFFSQDQMGFFHCLEIDSYTKSKQKQRALVLTHSSILQVDLRPPQKEFGHIVLVGNYSALNAVKRQRNNPSLLILEWKSAGATPLLNQLFSIQEIDKFLELLLENMRLQGAEIESRLVKQIEKIVEQEVNPEGLKKINITAIINQITLVEAKCDDQMIYEHIDQLIKLYQAAVEYYSALNDPQFDYFLNKMQQLMSDEHILEIYLAGSNPEVKPKMRDYLEDEILEHGIREEPITEQNEQKFLQMRTCQDFYYE